ncbi:MAG: hypothetical protein ACI4Q3_10915 [Kiritimatiellia bacterium]
MKRIQSMAVAMGALMVSAATIQMPEGCTTPDGMAVSPDGKLVIACPNNNRKQPGAIFRLDEPGGTPVKWFEVPALASSGYAQPMGICFGPAGELYVCDCQKKGEARILRITVRDNAIDTCETVAEGLHNANGIKYLNGRLYMTQAFLYDIPREDGAATSGVYMFNASDRNVRVTNTPADPQCVFVDVTRNPKIACGLNGIAVDAQGALFVDNYGDGRLWKLIPGAEGRIVRAELVAWTGMKTPDGLCVDAAGNVYTADMFGNAAVKIDRKGRVTTVAEGCFVRPSEPCVWRGNLYIANYGATTLSEIPLK